MPLGTCSTHGEVDARATYRGTALALHCACGLKAAPVLADESEPEIPLGAGKEPVDLEDILEAAAQGGGWFEFEDGGRRRGRAAALRYLMEGN